MSNDGPAHSLATHLINQTLGSIAILETLNIVTPSDAHLIRSKLPPASGPFPSLETRQHPSSSNIHNLQNSFSSLNVGAGRSNSPHSPHDYRAPPPQSPIPPSQSQQFSQPPTSPYQPIAPALPPRSRAPESRARALWDYSGTEHDDLTFRSGDILIIDEEVNDQWYRGRVIPQGQNMPLDRSGLFPSNYIEKLSSSDSRQYSSPVPPPQHAQMVPYQPPGPIQPYGYDKPPPQHQQMMHAPPPPMSGPPTYMIQEQEQRKGRFGKLGGQMGTAVATGMGFGAGSALASEAVHAIF